MTQTRPDWAKTGPGESILSFKRMTHLRDYRHCTVENNPDLTQVIEPLYLALPPSCRAVTAEWFTATSKFHSTIIIGRLTGRHISVKRPGHP